MNRFTLSLTPESGIGFDLTMRKWCVRPLAVMMRVPGRRITYRRLTQQDGAGFMGLE